MINSSASVNTQFETEINTYSHFKLEHCDWALTNRCYKTSFWLLSPQTHLHPTTCFPLLSWRLLHFHSSTPLQQIVVTGIRYPDKHGMQRNQGSRCPKSSGTTDSSIACFVANLYKESGYFSVGYSEQSFSHVSATCKLSLLVWCFLSPLLCFNLGLLARIENIKCNLLQRVRHLFTSTNAIYTGGASASRDKLCIHSSFKKVSCTGAT